MLRGVVWLVAVVTCVSSVSPVTFTIKPQVPIGNVSDRFLSFTIDAMMIRSDWKGTDHPLNFTDPTFKALAKAFAPAYVRIGGTAADNVTYSVTDGDIPNGVLTAAIWDEVNAFATAVGWDIVFGLNNLYGWDREPGHAWDANNSRSLIKYTKDKKYPVVGWELGNESNLKNKGGPVVTVDILVNHFKTFAAMLGEMYTTTGGGTVDSPYLIGPDTTSGSLPDGYLKGFLDGFRDPGVDVVTWHHYYTAGRGHPVVVSDYTDPTFLNKYVDLAVEAQGIVKATTPTSALWMGETSGAGGATSGSANVIGKYLGIFWFADKMGSAAAAGHSVICKQQFQYQVLPIPGGGARVTPEFWLTILWKRLMGRTVLTVEGDRRGIVRVYAHSNSSTSLTAVVINLGTDPTEVDLKVVTTTRAFKSTVPRAEYHMTAWPPQAGVEATEVALNGKQMEILPGGGVPDFIPKAGQGSVVTVAGHSVAFVSVTL